MPRKDRSKRRGVLRALLAIVAVLLPPGTALAQNFDGARFLDQCLRLEAGGDYVTARESCLNVLQLEASNTEAILALARIEIELGNISSAQSRLQQVRARVATAEPALLLADIAIRMGRLDEAESHLSSARSQLASQPNNELAARHAFMTGRVAESRGELQVALGSYRQAAAAEPLVSRYYEAAAGVLMAMGLPEAAVAELNSYREASGERGSAQLHSLLGQAQWAGGNLALAASEFESAFTLRAGRDGQAQAEDLRSLAAIYYGMGDLQNGNLALRDSLRQGNLLRLLAGNGLVWIILLLLLAGAHLIAESNVTAGRTLIERTDNPQMWSVGRVYGILIVGALLGIAAALAYSGLVLDNWLAFVTPLQAADVYAVFVVAFTIVAVAGTWITVRQSGWDVMERLLGGGNQLLPGLGLGVLLLAVIIGWMAYVQTGFMAARWYFDLNHLTPLVLAALIVVPFSELYFRALVVPAFERRYGAQAAVGLSAALYALVLGTPAFLLLVLGAILGWAFLRSRSGLLVLVAQFTVSAGLLLLNTVVPWIGTLFR